MGELDVVFSVVDTKPPARLRQMRLTNMPLVLLVPRKSPVRSAQELWTQKRVAETLICLPSTTVVARAFQRELKRRGVVWPQGIEATSVDLIGRYVANGDGIGVSVAKAQIAQPRELRVLPLDDFEPWGWAFYGAGKPQNWCAQ
jgi:DNA-binding transcriptional LysR family regulator